MWIWAGPNSNYGSDSLVPLTWVDCVETDCVETDCVETE